MKYHFSLYSFSVQQLLTNIAIEYMYVLTNEEYVSLRQETNDSH